MQQTRFDVGRTPPSILIQEYHQLFSMFVTCDAVEDMLTLYDGR